MVKPNVSSGRDPAVAEFRKTCKDDKNSGLPEQLGFAGSNIFCHLFFKETYISLK